MSDSADSDLDEDYEYDYSEYKDDEIEKDGWKGAKKKKERPSDEKQPPSSPEWVAFERWLEAAWAAIDGLHDLGFCKLLGVVTNIRITIFHKLIVNITLQ